MKCPKCKEDIEYVHVKSYCYQDANVDDHGLITSYDEIDTFGDPVVAYCPLCDNDIIKSIKQ